MRLPFTREEFFALFGAYNEALWPAVLALWIASVVICARLLLSGRASDRSLSALLCVHWAWAGLVYHAAFFSGINPAAWGFAAMFVLQAALLFRSGLVHHQLAFRAWRDAWAPVAWALIGYSLAYPAINAVQHGTWSAIPTFGVPCPTTIFTAGVLMLASPRAWHLYVVPVIWSFIGGSAAFLLGVRADYALPIAGTALAVFAFGKTK